MRLVRFRTGNGAVGCGIIRDRDIHVIEGDLLGPRNATGEKIPLDDVRLLAPVVPVNLLAIGLNYKAHVEEGNNVLPSAPLLFIKATTAVTDPETAIRLPAMAPDRVDYEAEMAVVIARQARNVPVEKALDHVLGYTCANDVSARDCQTGDGQWARGKSFDTFAPLGPWVETEFDPADKRIQGRLNGRVMQDSRTSCLIFKVPYLISYLSRCMTLRPGTVILTGTPEGVGVVQKPPVLLKPGDVFEVEVEGIGVLRNPVAAE